MLKVFSVFDSKAVAFIQPFFSVNSAVAIRDFSRAARDPSTGFFQHPADFTLFELGEWDPSSGSLVMGDKVALGSALEFRAADEELHSV